jgi:hypothetical protein
LRDPCLPRAFKHPDSPLETGFAEAALSLATEQAGRKLDAFEDFADCAALMSLMDEIVTVDTAAVHLAGAIGIPRSRFCYRIGLVGAGSRLCTEIFMSADRRAPVIGRALLPCGEALPPRDAVVQGSP